MARLSQKQVRNTPGKKVSKVDPKAEKEKVRIAKKEQADVKAKAKEYQQAVKTVTTLQKACDAKADELMPVIRFLKEGEKAPPLFEGMEQVPLAAIDDDDKRKRAAKRAQMDANIVKLVKKNSKFVDDVIVQLRPVVEVLAKPKDLDQLMRTASGPGVGGALVALTTLVVVLRRIAKMKLQSRK